MKIKKSGLSFLTISDALGCSDEEALQQNRLAARECLARLMGAREGFYRTHELADRVNSSYALTMTSEGILGRTAALVERELEYYEKICDTTIAPSMRRRMVKVFDRVLKKSLRQSDIGTITILAKEDIPQRIAQITETVAEILRRFVEKQILDCDFDDLG